MIGTAPAAILECTVMEVQYSFGTAVGLLKSVIAFVLMIGANKLAQKYTDSKIF